MAVDFSEASEGASDLERKVWVAIKPIIYTTSGPERIRNGMIQMTVMQSCRGCRYTSQMIGVKSSRLTDIYTKWLSCYHIIETWNLG